MATVLRTIGSAQDDGASTGLAISSVAGTGPYVLTLNQSVTFAVGVGDTVEDSSSNVYVVSAVVSSIKLNVVDEYAVGTAPAIGTGIVGRVCVVDGGREWN